VFRLLDIAGPNAFDFNVFWVDRGVVQADAAPDAVLQQPGTVHLRLDARA